MYYKSKAVNISENKTYNAHLNIEDLGLLVPIVSPYNGDNMLDDETSFLKRNDHYFPKLPHKLQNGIARFLTVIF